MKTASLICRNLLGLIFVAFGLNGFLHFIPQPPLPPGLASQFLGALVQSHYFEAVCACQILAGVLLLANRYVPLALVILGPVIANILLYHVLMAPAAIPPAIVATILWGVVFYSDRSVFQPIWSTKLSPA